MVCFCVTRVPVWLLSTREWSCWTKNIPRLKYLCAGTNTKHISILHFYAVCKLLRCKQTDRYLITFLSSYINSIYHSERNSAQITFNTSVSRAQKTHRFPLTVANLNTVTIWVTIDGVWFGNRIYWIPWYSSWLNFTDLCYTHTLVYTVTSSLPLLGIGFQWRMFPFLWVPYLSPALATSFSQQQLTTSEPSRYLIHYITLRLAVYLQSVTNSSLVLLITSRHGPHRKSPFLYWCLRAAA
jgi:hypothetical protein